MTGYIMLDAPNRAQPQGTYPRRGGHKPSGTCIVHTSEGNWRNGVDSLTRLVQTRADWGCYHRACDWADIALYYPWDWETWQDTETNNWAVGIAAACKASDWPTMPADIREGYYRNLARMAADFVVYMRNTYGVNVPLRRLTGAEARNRVPGFCAHGDSGIHRSDPGPAFDWALFFNYTRQALAGATTQSTEEYIMSWNTKIQEYGKDGKTKAGIKTAAFIMGNLNQWVSRILDGQRVILAETRALREVVKQATAAGPGAQIDYGKVDAIVKTALAEADMLRPGDVVDVNVNVQGK